jgi:hypothetical protein
MTSETDINLPETALTRMADRGGGPAISFQDVSKHFPAADGNRLEVLRDVSFDVRIGNVVAFSGPPVRASPRFSTWPRASSFPTPAGWS